MSMNRSLIVPTSNPALEQALQDSLQSRRPTHGSFGELELLALRLAKIQNTVRPQLESPHLLVFAADHGIAVDGVPEPQTPPTSTVVQQLLHGKLPLPALARLQGLQFTVVDAGLADRLPPHDHLLMRKIAHGTRNARVGPAMSLEQTHAAIRAGMEIGDSLPGNAVACSALGVSSHESASLVLSRLSGIPVRDFLFDGSRTRPERLAHLMVVAQGAQGRHLDVTDPVEVLAAFGGFEIAMMVGVMLVAAGKRHLIIVDGIGACAALRVASSIAESVGDYCLFSRSHAHRGLDQALRLFQATAMLELGLDTLDGTGAALAWPLVQSAATLLADAGEEEAAAAGAVAAAAA
jgi:nicotinate-nucleotide--dimethylbenzimidazole phosphoribosyltransferase